MKNTVVTFGEIMLRISPLAQGERIAQASHFTIEPGGSESNVAIGLSQLGHSSRFVTKLPRSILSDKIIWSLNAYSVDTASISYGGERVGSYWTEIGVGPRPSQVHYDRAGSSFSHLSYGDINWASAFKNACWFHSSGISAAVSEKACTTLLKVLDNTQRNVTISIDLNFRSKLWEWARRRNRSIPSVMWKICAKANVLFGNETDFQDALGFPGDGPLAIDQYDRIAALCFKRLPRLRYLAVSLRQSTSASDNGWSGLLFVKKNRKIARFKGPDIQVTNIVDRIGTGDSFAAGMIHGLMSNENDFQRTIDIAIALSALNHTVRGDASQFVIKDAEQLLKNRGGRVIR